MSARSLLTATVSSLLLVILSLAAARFAECTPKRDVSADSLLSKLRQTYPETRFLSVTDSPINGLFFVLMPRNSAYTDAEGNRFIFGGTLVNMTDKTASAPSDLFPAASGINAEDMSRGASFTYETGHPVTASVTVFSDIDCPYCMKTEKELLSIKGLQVEVILYPIDELHPYAYRKSVQVWCSEHPAEVYLSAMLDPNGRDVLDGLPDDCPNPVRANQRLGRKLGIRATPALIAPNGKRMLGYRSSETLARWIRANQT